MLFDFLYSVIFHMLISHFPLPCWWRRCRLSVFIIPQNCGECKGEFFSDVAALPQWCYGFAIVMYCALSAKWCDVSAFSRAKRTSLAKQTSRPKCTSRSFGAEHIVEKSQVEFDLAFFLAHPYKIDPYHKFFRNRSVVFSRWIDLSLGDDGSSTWPLSSGQATPCL